MPRYTGSTKKEYMTLSNFALGQFTRYNLAHKKKVVEITQLFLNPIYASDAIGDKTVMK
jgi:hypothetical protein